MRLPRVESGGVSALDLTPLVDVVLSLLAFFILTSSYMLQPGINIRLPKAGHAENVKRHRAEITIDRHGRIHVQGREGEVSMAQLDTELARFAREDTPVLIKADAEAQLQNVVEVWDHCKRQGIRSDKLSIATQADYGN